MTTETTTTTPSTALPTTTTPPTEQGLLEVLDYVHEKQEAEHKFQPMPPLEDDEVRRLTLSIAENGVLTPILVDENGEIIEGHHRKWVAEKLGVFCPRRTDRGHSDVEKLGLAMSLNLDRRHLTQEQKRDILAKSLISEPGLSNVTHAKRTGTTDKTAASVRAELEASSEIPRTENRIDRNGHKRPATRGAAERALGKPRPPSTEEEPGPRVRPATRLRHNREYLVDTLANWWVPHSTDSVLLCKPGALEHVTPQEKRETLEALRGYMRDLRRIEKTLAAAAAEQD